MVTVLIQAVTADVVDHSIFPVFLVTSTSALTFLFLTSDALLEREAFKTYNVDYRCTLIFNAIEANL